MNPQARLHNDPLDIIYTYLFPITNPGKKIENTRSYEYMHAQMNKEKEAVQKIV